MTGIIGASGNIGRTGEDGWTGFTGGTGDRGDVGFAGSPGATGPIGRPGEGGPSGLPGPAGATGFTGFRGLQGTVGEQGGFVCFLSLCGCQLMPKFLCFLSITGTYKYCAQWHVERRFKPVDEQPVSGYCRCLFAPVLGSYSQLLDRLLQLWAKEQSCLRHPPVFGEGILVFGLSICCFRLFSCLFIHSFGQT